MQEKSADPNTKTLSTNVLSCSMLPAKTCSTSTSLCWWMTIIFPSKAKGSINNNPVKLTKKWQNWRWTFWKIWSFCMKKVWWPKQTGKRNFRREQKFKTYRSEEEIPKLPSNQQKSSLNGFSIISKILIPQIARKRNWQSKAICSWLRWITGL